jgi:hypothetical protein
LELWAIQSEKGITKQDCKFLNQWHWWLRPKLWPSVKVADFLKGRVIDSILWRCQRRTAELKWKFTFKLKRQKRRPIAHKDENFMIWEAEKKLAANEKNDGSYRKKVTALKSGRRHTQKMTLIDPAKYWRKLRPWMTTAALQLFGGSHRWTRSSSHRPRDKKSTPAVAFWIDASSTKIKFADGKLELTRDLTARRRIGDGFDATGWQQLLM